MPDPTAEVVDHRLTAHDNCTWPDCTHPAHRLPPAAVALRPSDVTALLAYLAEVRPEMLADLRPIDRVLQEDPDGRALEELRDYVIDGPIGVTEVEAVRLARNPPIHDRVQFRADLDALGRLIASDPHLVLEYLVISGRIPEDEIRARVKPITGAKPRPSRRPPGPRLPANVWERADYAGDEEPNR